MKHFNLKLSIILCFFVLGIGSVSAQSVAFSHNHYAGIQAENDYPWSYMQNWSSGTHLDWTGAKSGTDSWTRNGTLGTSYEYIRRQNTGYMRGDLFDWFTLTYTTPPYTKVEYRIGYRITASVAGTDQAQACRAAFFDFGTDPNGYWSDRKHTPNGTTFTRTAFNDFYSNWRTYPNTTYGNPYEVLTQYGESASAYNEVTNGTKSSGDKAITWTIDNSTGSSNKVDYRRCGYFSSKTVGTNNRYTSLYMWKSAYTVTYYKQITFNPNGGKGEMTKQAIPNSAAIKANAFTRDGFTFAGWNTQPDGTGTPISDGATISASASDKGEVTLYAQWTPLPMTVKFDYTFRTSETAGVEKYEHMTTEDAGFTDKVRATFYDHNNNKLTSVILTAPAATDGAETPTDKIATHKTAALTLNVVKGTTESLTNEGPAYTLTLDAAKYAYGSVGFEVMKADESEPAAHWVTDEESATSYLFKYEGHTSANMFNLKWRVNLKELSMYPSDIFAKPMRKGTHTDDGGSTTLEPIPAMQNIKGIECKLAGYIDADNQDVTIETYNAMTPEQKAAFNKTGGAYYKGEYNVLKTCAHGQVYNYRIGLTGFILDGNPYYLAETEGEIPDDMISTTAVVPSLDNETDNDKIINYSLDATRIPVLILSPNGVGATVGGRSNYELYVDNNTNVDSEGKRIVNLNQFEALRDNYDFVGWKDAYDGTTYTKDGVYHFDMGRKATTTLLAQWQRNSAPTASYTIEEVGDNFKYVVTAIDALGDVDVKYIITETDATPAANAEGWESMDNQTDGTYTHTFAMLNDLRGKYIWAKAANADKSVIISMGQIRSIIKLQGICDLKSKTEETETIDEIPTTIDYYDYYTTFFFGDRTFKVSNIAYTAKVDGSQLTLMKIDPNDEGFVIIPKGTPVVLKKEQSTDAVIVLEECDQATTLGGNDLKGVDDATSKGSSDYYIFGENAVNDLGFYKNNTGQLEAHKAYFMLEKDDQNPNPDGFKLKDTTFTGINDVNVNGTANGATYDLLGRKVKATNAKSGIYIKDGKKIFIKE